MYDSSFLPENCYGRTEVCSMTLKDIADLAGVSMMTVSNVINGNQPRFPENQRQGQCDHRRIRICSQPECPELIQ